MALTPPLKYHGGKSYLADWIIGHFPDHDSYTTFLEPYCGGCQVLFKHNPENKSEVIGDNNRLVTNFWRVLASPELFEHFHRTVSVLPFSEEEFEASKAQLVSSIGEEPEEGWQKVQQAIDFFIVARQSMSGRMRSFAPTSKNRLRSGMNEQVSAWLGATSGLAEVAARLRRVMVRKAEALDLIDEFNLASTVIYCDPPYLHSTRSTTIEYGPHEMSPSDHEELLKALRKCKARVLISGYLSPTYEVLTDSGWNLHKYETPNHAAKASVKEIKTECLWTNF